MTSVANFRRTTIGERCASFLSFSFKSTLINLTVERARLKPALDIITLCATNQKGENDQFTAVFAAVGIHKFFPLLVSRAWSSYTGSEVRKVHWISRSSEEHTYELQSP